jgi:hypothetical protein
MYKKNDHIIIKRLTSIAEIPVIKKLGIIVKASSIPYFHYLIDSPMA